MSQDTDRDLSSAIRTEPGFKRLTQAAALGTGFQLLIVLCDSPLVIRKALELLEEDVSLITGSPAKVKLLDPYAGASDSGNSMVGRLLDSVLSALVHPPFHAHSGKYIRAIDGSAASTADEPTWGTLFRRMNERRNSIIRRVHGTILLCLTESLYPAFAREAPDFWSIRNAVIALSTPVRYQLWEARGEREEPSIVLRGGTPWMLASSNALSESVMEARTRSEARPGDQSAARAFALQLTRWGDLCSVKGDSRGASAAYREATAIAERLAQAEPDRADYQRDLVVSLVKVGTWDDPAAGCHLQRAWNVLLSMQSGGRLAPVDEAMIPALRKLLDDRGVAPLP